MTIKEITDLGDLDLLVAIAATYHRSAEQLASAQKQLHQER